MSVFFSITFYYVRQKLLQNVLGSLLSLNVILANLVLLTPVFHFNYKHFKFLYTFICINTYIHIKYRIINTVWNWENVDKYIQ